LAIKLQVKWAVTESGKDYLGSFDGGVLIASLTGGNAANSAVVIIDGE
jgi:hypothetical protein